MLKPDLRPSAPSEASPGITVLYGSQTGNGRRLAEQLTESLEDRGLRVRRTSTGSYSIRELATEVLLVFIVSTHGDGEPPDDAREFIDQLKSKRAPKLPGLQFTVLALGDSSYPKFCATGKEVDARLLELEAQTLFPRVECDVDYHVVAEQWIKDLTAVLATATNAPQSVIRPPRPVVASKPTKERPFTAQVLDAVRITGRNASKAVYHVELSLEGSGLTYQPGDAVGVWHENPPQVLKSVLCALAKSPAPLDPGAEVTLGDQCKPLKNWLQERELTRLTRPFLVQHAARTQSAELQQWLSPGNEAKLSALFKQRQLVDILQEYPAAWEPQALVEALRPRTPRLYSIASSQAEVGDEVHLTVAQVVYNQGSASRWGAASTHLAGLTTEGENSTVRLFIEPNERFQLPEDAGRDVIMIGPGTGIAPFRGFVQQRRQHGRGRNWLFFGARSFSEEFLYQAEWQLALKNGSLHRLSLAISRDRSRPKEYVQNLLRAAGRDVFDWLEQGAFLYVCGDAEHMAPDVHQTLIEVVQAHGGRSPDAAHEYVTALQRDRRYLRDVY